MEWALAILLAAAVVLLILSFYIASKTKQDQKRENEVLSATFIKEVNQLQEQISNVELDLEILAYEANLKSSSEQRAVLREVVDLHRRKYSLKTIAAKTNLSENEIEKMIEPFKTIKPKRGNVDDES
ncbi:hypothetical protein IEO70_12820 [Bacillus sp. AGMB 02131]|uniref:Uncharacterized protein n=1 Tax=Peribacillus faecalis TaxID=2772559 RepID=A0A927D0J1_9BACI|nr:hypothetical protein [Peribacillus faecalis]MBD3109230.1 hypothetical protein [Peribacillus faecalis]